MIIVFKKIYIRLTCMLFSITYSTFTVNAQNTFTWPTHKDLFTADQPNILRENVKRYLCIGNDANMFHI